MVDAANLTWEQGTPRDMRFAGLIGAHDPFPCSTDSDAMRISDKQAAIESVKTCVDTIWIVIRIACPSCAVDIP